MSGIPDISRAKVLKGFRRTKPGCGLEAGERQPGVFLSIFLSVKLWSAKLVSQRGEFSPVAVQSHDQ